MDLTKLLVGLGLTFVVAFSLFTYGGFLNDKYSTIEGSGNITTSFYSSYSNISEYVADRSQDAQIANQLDTVQSNAEDTGTQQVRVQFGILKDMVAQIPKLIGEAASGLGLPAEYANMARFIFGIAFTLLTVFLLFTGVKKLFA